MCISGRERVLGMLSKSKEKKSFSRECTPRCRKSILASDKKQLAMNTSTNQRVIQFCYLREKCLDTTKYANMQEAQADSE